MPTARTLFPSRFRPRLRMWQLSLVLAALAKQHVVVAPEEGTAADDQLNAEKQESCDVADPTAVPDRVRGVDHHPQGYLETEFTDPTDFDVNAEPTSATTSTSSNVAGGQDNQETTTLQTSAILELDQLEELKRNDKQDLFDETSAPGVVVRGETLTNYNLADDMSSDAGSVLHLASTSRRSSSTGRGNAGMISQVAADSTSQWDSSYKNENWNPGTQKPFRPDVRTREDRGVPTKEERKEAHPYYREITDEGKPSKIHNGHLCICTSPDAAGKFDESEPLQYYVAFAYPDMLDQAVAWWRKNYKSTAEKLPTYDVTEFRDHDAKWDAVPGSATVRNAVGADPMRGYRNSLPLDANKSLPKLDAERFKQLAAREQRNRKQMYKEFKVREFLRRVRGGRGKTGNEERYRRMRSQEYSVEWASWFELWLMSEKYIVPVVPEDRDGLIHQEDLKRQKTQEPFQKVKIYTRRTCFGGQPVVDVKSRPTRGSREEFTCNNWEQSSQSALGWVNWAQLCPKAMKFGPDDRSGVDLYELVLRKHLMDFSDEEWDDSARDDVLRNLIADGTVRGISRNFPFKLMLLKCVKEGFEDHFVVEVTDQEAEDAYEDTYDVEKWNTNRLGIWNGLDPTWRWRWRSGGGKLYRFAPAHVRQKCKKSCRVLDLEYNSDSVQPYIEKRKER
ncbi:unnamed protein product [Amoebophrya sp. A120]|nr:unnamed protein product [Amoebophrya sp. A120]|eukprot:GSA120T00018561001.1